MHYLQLTLVDYTDPVCNFHSTPSLCLQLTLITMIMFVTFIQLHHSVCSLHWSVSQALMGDLGQIRQDAFRRMAESRNATRELKLAARQIMRAEDEVKELKEDNAELAFVLLKLRTIFRLRQVRWDGWLPLSCICPSNV
jgi:hypothetical protein